MQNLTQLKGLFFLLLLTLLFLNSCKSPESENLPSRHIVGTVTDKTNGSPIENALIELEFMTTKVLASTYTDKNGYYSIKYYEKPSNMEDVRASADGYIPQFEGIKNTTDTQTINFLLSPRD